MRHPDVCHLMTPLTIYLKGMPYAVQPTAGCTPQDYLAFYSSHSNMRLHCCLTA